MGELYLKTVKKSLCRSAQWCVLITLAHQSLKKKDLLSQRTWAKATKQDSWFKQIKKQKQTKKPKSISENENGVCLFCFVLLRQSYCVVQASLRLKAILLPQLPECWN